MRISSLAIALTCLFCFIFTAPRARAEEDDSDEVDSDEVDSEVFEDIQGIRTQPLPMLDFSFGIGLSYRSDNQSLVFDETGVADTFEIHEFQFLPRFSFAPVPGKLAVFGDLQMGILWGDSDSSFVMESFAFGGQYTFLNSSPFVLAAGLGMRFISQSYQDFFSMDVFHLRPYLTGGPVIDIGALMLCIIPYVGLPLYFDTSDENDPDFIDGRVRTTPGSQGGPLLVSYSRVNSALRTATYINASGEYDKNDPSLPPNRRQNYFLDESPGGIDYGLPVILDLPLGLFGIVEVFGTTWLWPERDSWNYAGPTVGWAPGFFAVSLSWIFALDHKDIQEDWSFSVGFAVMF